MWSRGSIESKPGLSRAQKRLIAFISGNHLVGMLSEDGGGFARKADERSRLAVPAIRSKQKQTEAMRSYWKVECGAMQSHAEQAEPFRSHPKPSGAIRSNPKH